MIAFIKKSKYIQSSLLHFVFFILLNSCNNKQNKIEIRERNFDNLIQYTPSRLIDSLTKAFLDSSNCQNCVNELYIDKLYDDEFYFTYIARDYAKDYFVKKLPFIYFSTSGKNIFVYTGAESFISGNVVKYEQFDFSENKDNVHYLRMQFRLLNDSIYPIDAPAGPFSSPITPSPTKSEKEPKFDPDKNYSQ